MHIIKQLTILENIISTESIPEECTETVHVLIGETQWVQFCSNSSALPSCEVWYLQLGKKNILAL